MENQQPHSSSVTRETTHPGEVHIDTGKAWREAVSGRSGKVGWRQWTPTILLAIAFAAFVLWTIFRPEPSPPTIEVLGLNDEPQLTVASRTSGAAEPALIPPQTLDLRGEICNNTSGLLAAHVTTYFRRFANGEPEIDIPYRDLSPIEIPAGCTEIDLSLSTMPDLPPGSYVFYGEIYLDGSPEQFFYQSEPFRVLGEGH